MTKAARTLTGNAERPGRREFKSYPKGQKVGAFNLERKQRRGGRRGGRRAKTYSLLRRVFSGKQRRN